ncbi:hypothetical protein [Geosporobacter ferrireducens]|uniref:Uncharacterized protein n=1 Tax=Geosporobacter ferrireducens TaxID=1424294 RepID=A0A1D8GLB4_9FIRM|nr:hypothetical protein [Geosporobacter ferrireducens]AOT71693.1 hypothetical protein Gferi_20430 [Geosporobacter ferrireducens]MTI55467.1 hypothetical protein [Geosporobacter ferrireducens]
MKAFFRNLFIVAIVSYLLHYAWEYWQCGIFYATDDSPAHALLMASATFGDMVMSIFLYALLAVVATDVAWIRKLWNTACILI